MLLFFLIWRYVFVYEILTVNIWEVTPIRAGDKGAGVNLGPM